MADAWTGFLRDIVNFLEKRGEAYQAGSFASPKAIIVALAAGDSPHQALLTSFADTIGDGTGLSGANKTMFDAVTKSLANAKTELDKVKALVGGTDFTMGNAKDAASSLGKIVSDYLDAIGAIAKQVAGGNSTTEQDINGILEPWTEGFSGVASGATSKFDSICNSILGVSNATSDLVHRIQLDLADKRINVVLAGIGSHSVGPLAFDGAEIKGYVQYDPPAVGISLNTNINAGLESDPLLSKVMPGGAAANSDPVGLQVDTDKGFSLGGGKAARIVVPARLTLPLVELRELALAIPTPKAGDPARFDVELSLAGKLGDVIGFVCDGVGVSILSDADGNLSTQPKPPDALGVSINVGPVSGGGYLSYDGTQYGGALKLKIYSWSLTAVGLYMPSKNALLVVIGLKFSPGIQIGFGFSIVGVGGLLASQRTVSVDALSSSLKDGAVSNILMPDDPVQAAPKILQQLSAIFPPADGVFVVGPIVAIGWGAGMITAKVGVLIQFPDPAVIILGELVVKVPPLPDAGSTGDKKLAIVDLTVDLFAAIEPDEFYLKASLIKSKIAGMAIGGDLALLIKWGGDAAFAFSAGGFFPTYKYPPELAGLQRLSIEMKVGSIVKITITAYVAVTSNSVQFGGAVALVATVGPASGEASLSIDAMFVWSPHFAFIVEFSASVAIKLFGHTIAGASFRGTVQGTRPWSLEGDASISILFWDFDFHIGPVQWGEVDTSVLPLIDSLAEVMGAFAKDEAWTPLPPPQDSVVTIARSGADTASVLDPFTLIQANQTVCPFDMDINLLGNYTSSVKRFGFANPTINGAPAPAFSEVQDDFAPGQFKTMTTDQKAAAKDFEQHPGGIQIAPAAGAAIGAAANATVEWDTSYPQFDVPVTTGKWDLGVLLNAAVLATSAVAKARRKTGNPYAPIAAGPVKMADAGIVEVAPLATAVPANDAAPMNTSAALTALAAANATGADMQIIALGLAA